MVEETGFGCAEFESGQIAAVSSRAVSRLAGSWVSVLMYRGV